MKQLRQFQKVQDALVTIAKDAEAANGVKVKCYLYDTQHTKTKEYIALEAEIVKKKFANIDYSEEYSRLSKMPMGKSTMIFRLLETMTIRGSKQITYDNKLIYPEIKTNEIYIPEDIVNNTSAGLQYDETDQIEHAADGTESPVIILDLGKCTIDVAKGQKDWKDNTRWIKAPRAYVTDIPYRSMQIVGSILAGQERANRDAMNYLADDQLVNL